MAKLHLRLKAKNGSHILDHLTTESTFNELQNKISELTEISVTSIKILHGYPPKLINPDDSKILLALLNLRSGDTLTIEEDAARANAENQRQSDKLHEEVQRQYEQSLGILTRHVVPANNSCLFVSVDFVLSGAAKVNLASAKPMRELIARIVAGDPITYNEAFLGRTNSAYCKWILDDKTWGGGIEISILSRHHSVEIDIIDCQTGRIDRFGEDRSYRERVILIYDGVHYDPIVLESVDESSGCRTKFSTSDHEVMSQALDIGAEAKASRQFTDCKTFTLKCLDCNIFLKGENDAVQHSKDTGHVNFGEVQQSH